MKTSTRNRISTKDHSKLVDQLGVAIHELAHVSAFATHNMNVVDAEYSKLVRGSATMAGIKQTDQRIHQLTGQIIAYTKMRDNADGMLEGLKELHLRTTEKAEQTCEPIVDGDSHLQVDAFDSMPIPDPRNPAGSILHPTSQGGGNSVYYEDADTSPPPAELDAATDAFIAALNTDEPADEHPEPTEERVRTGLYHLKILSDRYGSTDIVCFHNEDDAEDYIHRHDPDGHYVWTYAATTDYLGVPNTACDHVINDVISSPTKAESEITGPKTELRAEYKRGWTEGFNQCKKHAVQLISDAQHKGGE